MNSSIMNDFDDYMLSRNIKFLVTVIINAIIIILMLVKLDQ